MCFLRLNLAGRPSSLEPVGPVQTKRVQGLGLAQGVWLHASIPQQVDLSTRFGLGLARGSFFLDEALAGGRQASNHLGLFGAGECRVGMVWLEASSCFRSTPTPIQTGGCKDWILVWLEASTCPGTGEGKPWAPAPKTTLRRRPWRAGGWPGDPGPCKAFRWSGCKVWRLLVVLGPRSLRMLTESCVIGCFLV